VADDLFNCINVTGGFLGGASSREDAISKAVSFCEGDKDLAEPTLACPHFKEAVSRALELEPKDKLFDAKSFCEATEAYMINIRGASRVPRTGKGALLNFEVSDHCTTAVAAAFAPDKTLASSSVPDFWYAMCMNQDCAHFLPSRAKWCNVHREPTHSVVVCEAARRFAIDEVVVHESGAMSPEQICALYGEFVEEMGMDLSAYEQVVHGRHTHEPKQERSQGHRRALARSVTTLLLVLLGLAPAVAMLDSA